MSNRVPIDSFGTPLHTKDGVGLSKVIADQLYVNSSGDTMAAALDMNSYQISNLGGPENSTDAVNKMYVDRACNLLAKQTYVTAERERLQELINAKQAYIDQTKTVNCGSRLIS